jgi:hypothetical protein
VEEVIKEEEVVEAVEVEGVVISADKTDIWLASVRLVATVEKVVAAIEEVMVAVAVVEGLVLVEVVVEVEEEVITMWSKEMFAIYMKNRLISCQKSKEISSKSQCPELKAKKLS